MRDLGPDRLSPSPRLDRVSLGHSVGKKERHFEVGHESHDARDPDILRLPYRQVIEIDDHSLFVLEDERIHNFHVALLDAELDEVGEVLQALGHHDEGAVGGGRGRLRDEVELTRIEDGGTQEAKEDEPGDSASLDESLVRPLDGHVALETVADVPAYVGKCKCVLKVGSLFLVWVLFRSPDHLVVSVLIVTPQG